MKEKKGSFSGSIGFVLAAAGSAVGVGNIWRFPYLCAKDGGGLFLLIYLMLVLTFGFVLLTTDVAIGRKTKKNALNAFAAICPKWKFLGYLTFLVPVLIMTYYSVIGGWITKYFVEYLVSGDNVPAQDGYFTSFITSKAAPIVFMLSGADSSGRLRRCGKGNRKGFELYYACTGCFDCGDCDFFPDAVGRRGGRYGSDGNAGTGDLSAAGFSWTDGETVSGDFAGCDEPAVFLPECFDGHHGDLWFLCKR